MRDYWAYDTIEGLRWSVQDDPLEKILSPHVGVSRNTKSYFSQIKKTALTSSVIWTLLK